MDLCPVTQHQARPPRRAVDPQAANFTRAHAELARFLAGDTTPNNPLRAH